MVGKVDTASVLIVRNDGGGGDPSRLNCQAFRGYA